MIGPARGAAPRGESSPIVQSSRRIGQIRDAAVARDGWHCAACSERSWRDEAGQLMTDQEGASIHGEFGIPARATIEFEISWKKKPDFVFALGTSDQPESVKRAFRFEAWGGDLIVQRELEKEADLAVVQEIGTGPGRAHFQVYLDQEENKITIFSALGKQLASLKVGELEVAGAIPEWT